MNLSIVGRGHCTLSRAWVCESLLPIHFISICTYHVYLPSFSLNVRNLQRCSISHLYCVPTTFGVICPPSYKSGSSIYSITLFVIFHSPKTITSWSPFSGNYSREEYASIIWYFDVFLPWKEIFIVGPTTRLSQEWWGKYFMHPHTRPNGIREGMPVGTYTDS